MIRQVQLTNWKAYERLSLDLTEGTTFVVAYNGVGKSSLVQGVFWTMFGSPALSFSAADAIRGDSRSATGEVHLDLADFGEVSIVRTASTDDRGRLREDVEFEVDGKSAKGASNLEALFERACGLSGDQLTRLHVLTEAAVASELDPKVRFSLPSHVARLFGTEALRSTASSLDGLARRLSSEGDRLRRDVTRDVTTRIQERDKSLAELKNRIASTQQERSDLQGRLELLSEQEARGAQWEAHDALVADRQAAVKALADKSSPLIGGPTDAGEFGQRLTETLQRAREHLETTRHHQIRLAAQSELIGKSLALLSEDSETCPVCRRPLGPDDRAAASREHTAEQGAIQAELSTVEDTLRGATSSVDQLEDVLSQFDALRRPEAPPVDRPSTSLADLRHELRELDKRVQVVSERLGSLRRDQEELVREQEGDQAALSGNRAAEGCYRSSELAAAASSAMSLVESRVQAEQLRPLIDELRLRWKDLWPDRHGLQLLEDGSLAFERESRLIKYEQFSGAEKGLSLAALRLLIVQMTSPLRILWLDEPLEHLDGRNRRVLASMLASAGTHRALDQVVVTTYEEPVVRKLGGSSDANGCQLVYVRSADA